MTRACLCSKRPLKGRLHGFNIILGAGGGPTVGACVRGRIPIKDPTAGSDGRTSSSTCRAWNRSDLSLRFDAGVASLTEPLNASHDDVAEQTMTSCSLQVHALVKQKGAPASADAGKRDAAADECHRCVRSLQTTTTRPSEGKRPRHSLASLSFLVLLFSCSAASAWMASSVGILPAQLASGSPFKFCSCLQSERKPPPQKPAKLLLSAVGQAATRTGTELESPRSEEQKPGISAGVI